MSETRPEFVKQEHLDFLDVLRESGETNMFGARPFLEREFPELTGLVSSKVLSYWMKTFGQEAR